MPERSSYAHGVPSWVDVASPDVDASAAFYGGLFGWEHVTGENPEESGGYSLFTKNEMVVAGIAPLQNPEQPPVWSTYVNVDDADDVVAKAQEAGGQIAFGPIDVLDAGRMAFLIDTTGAIVGIWQAGKHHGAELVSEAGALGWTELTTRDTDAAKDFYGAVFGWEAAAWEGSELLYTIWKVDGHGVCGMIEMDENWPQEMPSHWMTYFIVDDADDAAATAQELGGTVSVLPFDAAGVGRITVLNDPHGTAFSVLRPEPPSEQ
ncbi:MAG: VOC family protein [Candidatus Limnocylindria bacterium]